MLDIQRERQLLYDFCSKRVDTARKLRRLLNGNCLVMNKFEDGYLTVREVATILNDMDMQLLDRHNLILAFLEWDEAITAHTDQGKIVRSLEKKIKEVACTK